VNESSESRRLLRSARRLWWLILVLAVAGGLAGFVVSQQITPVYQARTSVLVGESIRTANVDEGALKASAALAPTYADIVRRQPVLQSVVNSLGLSMSWLTLRDSVRVDVATSNPQLILVTVESTSPARAKAVAAGIADELVELNPQSADTASRDFVKTQLDELRAKIRDGRSAFAALESERAAAETPEEREAIELEIDAVEPVIQRWLENYASLAALAPDDSSATSLEVLEPAYAQPSPVRPRVMMNTLVGATIGGMVGLAFCYLLELRVSHTRVPAQPDLSMWLARGPNGDLLARPDGTSASTAATTPRLFRGDRHDDREAHR
jgi:capsular polysaccharide biosynthesis protein